MAKCNTKARISNLLIVCAFAVVQVLLAVIISKLLALSSDKSSLCCSDTKVSMMIQSCLSHFMCKKPKTPSLSFH